MKKILCLLFIWILLLTGTAFGIELVRQKNIDTRIVFPIVDADGDPVSDADDTTPDSEYASWSDSGHGGAAPSYADCTHEIVEIAATGSYYLDVSAAEINADYTSIKVTSGATGVKTQWILIRTTVGDPLNIATTDDGTAINVTSGAIDNVDLVDLTTTTTTATTCTSVTNDVNVTDADVAGAVWNAATASYGTSGTYGLLIETDLDATISSRGTSTFAVGQNVGTATTCTNVTNDVGITQTGADKVWGTTARVLTAGTNIALAKGTGVTGFNDITAANVWDLDISGYSGAKAGTYLKSLYDNQDWNPWDAVARTITGGTADTCTTATTCGTCTSVTNDVNLLDATEAQIDAIETKVKRLIP